MLLEVADVTAAGFRYVEACVVTVFLDNKIYSKKNQLHDGLIKKTPFAGQLKKYYSS